MLDGIIDGLVDGLVDGVAEGTIAEIAAGAGACNNSHPPIPRTTTTAPIMSADLMTTIKFN
jgi:hypothetical protein